MKQTRFQPLSQAYQQLTQTLYETLLCLYISDALPEHQNPLQKAEAALSLYECQMAKEEEMFFGFLYDYEPFVTAILRDDYRECMKHIKQIRKIIGANDADANTNHANERKHDMLYRFNAFLNCCTKQMQEHASLINPVLWRYYSDEELEQMSSAFVIEQTFAAPHTVAATRTSNYSMAV